jgi:type I site-specific restriction endonuclease
VALAPECNLHIAEASVRRMNALREATGTQHQIIAAACSIDHAKQVRAIYEQCGVRAREIYSEMDPDEQEAVLEALRQGRIDAIVQVQMLGEGFDHPRLSVAAVFRPFRSLSPYIQFVGRAMRVLHENERGHPDNQAFVVSHFGLNNDAHWEDFRELDEDDQEIFRRWLNNDEVHDPADDLGNGEPRRFDAGMQVSDEVISHFVMQPFLDPEDDRVLDKILEQKLPGNLTVGQIITREALREQLKGNLAKLEQNPSPITTSPQVRRRTTRPRVNERAKAVAARVLKDLKLTRPGRQIAKAVKSQRMRANYQAVLALMNNAINDELGIGRGKRNEPTADALEKVFARLDAIGDRVRASISKALGD